MPSGHKAFVVHNPRDVDLLLMHNKTFAAEYVHALIQPQFDIQPFSSKANCNQDLPRSFIEKESGYRSQGEAIGGQGYQREGSGNNRVLDGS